MKNLEYPYVPVSINTLQKHDAIVVLSSGATRKVGADSNTRYEIFNATRFFSGLELIKSFKADLLIFTGGKVPWTANWQPEGVILRDKAILLGINETNILVTKNTQNTYEESIFLLDLLQKKSSILLVTSAFHMHRSKFLFEKQGFEVTPFPVDFRSSNAKINFFSFFPNLGAMINTTLYIRENLGRLYYKLFY